METSIRAFLASALLFSCAPAFAQTQPPDLHHQDKWGDTQKTEFLKFLKSGAPAPASGQLKDMGAAGEGTRTAENNVSRKARFASLSLVGDTLVTVVGGGNLNAESTNFGPKLLVGGHLFSWVRYYGGVQYTNLQQKRLDGNIAQLSHWQVPIGLELALVPLGTPQTRYILLRGGLAMHYISGPGTSGDFAASLFGLQPSWNVGLGYEWQISETRWRWNILAEGYEAFNNRFMGAGITAGLAYTF